MHRICRFGKIGLLWIGGLIATPLIFSTIVCAENEITAPKFEHGAKYIFERTNFKHSSVGEYVLFFKGIDSEGNYDFGEYILTKHLARAKKGKPPRGYQPVKFPLKFGDTWSYSYTSPGNASCGELTRKMHATAGQSYEKRTVNGIELNVIRITHEGKWFRECSGNDLEGKNTFEYLYSPKLGMIVHSNIEIYSPNDDLKYNPGSVMKSFSIPR